MKQRVKFCGRWLLIVSVLFLAIGCPEEDDDNGNNDLGEGIPECDEVSATSVDECNDVTPETGEDVCEIALCALCVGYAKIVDGCEEVDCTSDPYKTAIDCYVEYGECVGDIDCSAGGEDVTPLTASCFEEYVACAQTE